MFSSEEVDFLLEDTLMVLGNSIPFDGTLVMSRKVHQRDETAGYGFMPALEILYGHPTISLYLSKPEMLEKALSQCCRHYHKGLFAFSFFEKFCAGDTESQAHLEKGVKYKLNADSIEYSRGVDLRPILERVLDMDQVTSLKILAAHIFKGPRKVVTQRMMMRNFAKMTEAGKLKLVPEIISDTRKEDGEEQSVNLETIVESDLLESYALKDLDIFPEVYKSHNDVESEMLDKMLQKDIELCVNGAIKIKHGFIDFGPLIFQRKLDFLVQNEQDRSSGGMNMQMTWLQISDICVQILD